MHPNANITCYIKKKKPLCNTLNWGNWNSGFVKLGVWWAERDIWHKNCTPLNQLVVSNLKKLIMSLCKYVVYLFINSFSTAFDQTHYLPPGTHDCTLGFVVLYGT